MNLAFSLTLSAHYTKDITSTPLSMSVGYFTYNIGKMTQNLMLILVTSTVKLIKVCSSYCGAKGNILASNKALSPSIPSPTEQ